MRESSESNERGSEAVPHLTHTTNATNTALDQTAEFSDPCERRHVVAIGEAG